MSVIDLIKMRWAEYEGTYYPDDVDGPLFLPVSMSFADIKKLEAMQIENARMREALRLLREVNRLGWSHCHEAQLIEYGLHGTFEKAARETIPANTREFYGEAFNPDSDEIKGCYCLRDDPESFYYRGDQP